MQRRRGQGAKQWISCALCIVASWFVSIGVRAQDSWRALPGCPDRAYAEARLRALNADPALLASGRASVWFDVSATGELRARVRMLHGDSMEQRVLYDASCAALAEAAVLVISLSFEDEHVAEGQREPEPSVNVQSASDLHLRLAPVAKLDVGSLPGATYGVGGALGLRVRRFSAQLEGTYFGARDGERDDRRARGSFGLAAGAARGCYRLADRWLDACAALELGRATGHAVGAEHVTRAHGLWAAALLGVALTLPTAYVSPVALVELGLPFQRPSFDVTGVGSVFQARPAIFRASLQLAFEPW